MTPFTKFINIALPVSLWIAALISNADWIRPYVPWFFVIWSALFLYAALDWLAMLTSQLDR